MSSCHTNRQADAAPLLFLEEINHRVVNQYTQAAASIRLAGASIRSTLARTALEAAANRLGDFAAAHRALLLPAEDEALDLGVYLERLCSALSAASLRERGIMLSLTAEPMMLDAARCWRAALIVAELVSNAARHALGGGGAVLVMVELFGDQVACRVIDNGGVIKQPSPSRGMWVVRALAEESGGSIHWTFGSHGSRAELTFPMHFDEKYESATAMRADVPIA